MGFSCHRVICVLNELKHLAGKFAHACHVACEMPALEHPIHAFTPLCRRHPPKIQGFEVSCNPQLPTIPKTLDSFIFPYAILIYQLIPCHLKLDMRKWVIDYC